VEGGIAVLSGSRGLLLELAHIQHFHVDLLACDVVVVELWACQRGLLLAADELGSELVQVLPATGGLTAGFWLMATTFVPLATGTSALELDGITAAGVPATGPSAHFHHKETFLLHHHIVVL
jgi:hypothetical protein